MPGVQRRTWCSSSFELWKVPPAGRTASRELYWQLNFMLLYGEFETERALRSFYERQGFTVLEPGECTDVGYVLTGRPIGLGAGPGEQLFFRWRKN